MVCCVQEVAAPVEDGASEQTTLLTGPIQGDVVTINQRPLDIRLLKVLLSHKSCLAAACQSRLSNMLHCDLCDHDAVWRTDTMLCVKDAGCCVG